MKKPAEKIGAAILAVALLFTLTPGQAPLTARAASDTEKNTETGRQIVRGIEVPEGTLEDLLMGSSADGSEGSSIDETVGESGNFSMEKDPDILSKDGFLSGSAMSSETSPSEEVLETVSYINDCSTDYAYKKLGELTGGAAMQKLYTRILNVMVKVYLSEKDLEAQEFPIDGVIETYYYAGMVSYEGVDESNLMTVYESVLMDHPLFFFMLNEYLYEDGKMCLLAFPEFYEGSVRQLCKEKINDVILGFEQGAAGLTSNYDIVKYVHDAIAAEVDYARDIYGFPETSPYVYGMAGYVSDNKRVVCEGYAETMAAALNYLDIENVIATGWGVASGQPTYDSDAHAWNMVKLGDGNFYHVDVTWDDQEYGTIYDYFCVGNEIFDSHSIIWNGGQNGIIYEIPETPDANFAGEDTILKAEDPAFQYDEDTGLSDENAGGDGDSSDVQDSENPDDIQDNVSDEDQPTGPEQPNSVVKVKKAVISSVKNKKKKSFQVQWKAVDGAEGYRITYATNKKLTKGKKKIFARETESSRTVKKLKKGKTYYVKVQAYKTDSAGKRVFGGCKKIMKVKIKK